jgi:hypothetical protein
MHHSDLEGGCWYLETDAGKRYELVADSGIMSSLMFPNRPLSLLVSPVKNLASVCMIGEMVHVEKIVDSMQYPVDMLVMNMQVTGTMHRTKKGEWYVRTSKGAKLLIPDPEKKYQHIGAKYDVLSRVIRGPKPNGIYAGTIAGPVDKKAMEKQPKWNPK